MVTIQLGEILLHYDVINAKSHAEPLRLQSRRGCAFDFWRGLWPWESAWVQHLCERAFRPLKKTQNLTIIRSSLRLNVLSGSAR